MTAIVFPVGSALGPAYDDVALVGDFNFGNLYRLPLNPARSGFDLSGLAGLDDLVADNVDERDMRRAWVATSAASRDLEIGPDGALYVVSIGAGAIYRIVSATADISGRVHYYVGDRSVSDVAVRRQGATMSSTSTGSDGAYAFNGVALGNHAIVPAKSGDARDGISTLDATRILQFVAGEQPFNQFQRLACDVTGNGACSPLDATRVLQFVSATLPRFPAADLCQSDWLFVPDAAVVPNQTLTQPQVAGACQMGRIAYVPLAGDAADQDFSAVLLGDVTGNWGEQ